jgi:porphobilinogen deaminase
MKLALAAHVYKDDKGELQEAFDISVVAETEDAEDVVAAYKLIRDKLDEE